MVGRRGRAISSFASGEGTAEIDGVHWRARSSYVNLAAGQPIRVTGTDGMTLVVEPAQTAD